MKNIPNILTVFRIVLVPVFLYLVYENQLRLATIVFITAGITDAVDGAVARAFGFRTELGALLDPLADKLLLSSSYIMLTYAGFLPLWLAIPVIFRDLVLFTGVIMFRRAGRKVVIKPTIFGKLTTTLQISTVVFAMVFPEAGPSFTTLAVVTAIMTIYTGFDYVWREIKIQTTRP